MNVHPLFPATTADDLRAARQVLLRPMRVEARDIRTACHTLFCSDDERDRLTARMALRMLDREDAAQIDKPLPEGASLIALTLAAIGIVVSAFLIWCFVELGQFVNASPARDVLNDVRQLPPATVGGLSI